MYRLRRAESRRSIRRASVVACAALAFSWADASAQDDATEAFLIDHNLDRYAETYLRSRAENATGDERVDLLERLGAYYAQRLADAGDDAERTRLLAAAGELLDSTNAGELTGLRLAFTVARYRPAEEIAERARLLLATDDEIKSALVLLRESGIEFDRVGQQLERDVLYQERRQRIESARDPGAVVPELAEAIRNRSLAKFYAGWAIVYASSLSGEQPAGAMESFAWVLDTPGEDPSLERLPRSLLRYPHVARSAIGVATAHSLAGNHAAAIDWFDAIEPEIGTQQDIYAQLISRKIEALSLAGRWEELRVLARERAGAEETGSARARLLAVVALSARASGVAGSARLTLEDIAGVALTDLVRQGELAHVIELSTRFGDLPLKGEGFAVAYVVGSELFTQARASHRASGTAENDPATSVAVRGLYRNAAQRLASALVSVDAEAFPRERAQAAFDAATCLYYADELADAVQTFLSAEELASEEAQRERSLWMAFIAADSLARRDESAAVGRLDLARRYLAEHPDGDRAPALLLRTLGADLVSEREAIRILRSVPPGDQTEVLARRELARLLYRRVRSVHGILRAEAASEFLSLARGLMTMAPGHPAAPSPDAKAQLARQVLDVALLLEPPAIELAKETFRLIDDIQPTTSSGPHADEFLLRRVQLSIAEERDADARAMLSQFNDPTGRFAHAAARLVWARTLSAWRRARTTPNARAVIADGRAFVEGTLYNPADAEHVADAGAWLWNNTDDAPARDLALAIDRRLVQSERYSETSLRRLAELAEASSRTTEAESAWLLLMAAKQQGKPGWFEARFQSLRLLASHDAQRARVVYDQLVAIYPSLGSEPWSTRLHTLGRSLPPVDDGPTP